MVGKKILNVLHCITPLSICTNVDIRFRNTLYTYIYSPKNHHEHDLYIYFHINYSIKTQSIFHLFKYTPRIYIFLLLRKYNTIIIFCTLDFDLLTERTHIQTLRDNYNK